jgi:hypothetical protein
MSSNGYHHGAAATVIDAFEAGEEAVTTFLQLLEEPGPVELGPLERFGPCLEPIETVDRARTLADYGRELDAARQAVDAHWERWRTDARPALRRFVAEVERRWLRSYPASELTEKQFPARREIVPGMIHEGLLLISGKSGLGKGWWALQLCLAVAQGGKVFNKIPVEAGDALYLSLEDDAAQMQERGYVFLQDGDAWPARLTIAHEAPTLAFGLYDRLEAWLKTHPHARLIVVDTLAKIRPPRRQNGDLYEQDYAIAEALKPLAYRYHVAVLILHHCNKLVDPADPLDAISGSTGLIAPADTKGVFTRARGEADAKLFLTGRAVREGWRAFRFEEGYWQYLGDAEDAERSEARQAIITVLREATGPVPRQVIERRLPGRNPNTLGVLLSKMVQAGEVKRVSRGVYALPLPPSPPINNINIVNKGTDVNIVNNGREPAQPPPNIYGDPPNIYDPVNIVSPEKTSENSPETGNIYDITQIYPHGSDPPADPPPIPRSDALAPEPTTETCVCGHTIHPRHQRCFRCQRPRGSGSEGGAPA